MKNWIFGFSKNQKFFFEIFTDKNIESEKFKTILFFRKRHVMLIFMINQVVIFLKYCAFFGKTHNILILWPHENDQIKLIFFQKFFTSVFLSYKQAIKFLRQNNLLCWLKSTFNFWFSVQKLCVLKKTVDIYFKKSISCGF